MSVLVACVGLGRVNRGIESFMDELVPRLVQAPQRALRVSLASGGGQPTPDRDVIQSPRQEAALSRVIGRLLRREPYIGEHLLFALSLIPVVMRRKPDVIYTGDRIIGRVLWYWRRLTRQRYALVLHNGTPVSPPYTHWDHVHQLTPSIYERSLEAGVPATRMSLLPLGFDFPKDQAPPTAAERASLRAELGLPLDRQVVISVGAVNAYHKRMDYLIRELATLPAPRPVLVMLGQQETETPDVVKLADSLLGTDGYILRQVPATDVWRWYRAADLFVLASLTEGFGRVYIEALSHGLPCICDDNETTRYVVQNYGFRRDLRKEGELATCLKETLAGIVLPSYTPHETARAMRQRFGWDVLLEQFVAMFQRSVLP